MVRKILAVVLGCAAVALLSLVLDPVAGVLVRTFAGPKGPLFVAALGNVVALFLASIGGGILATLVARHRGPANVLACLALAAGLAYALQPKQGGMPSWYGFGLPAAGALGTFLGGWIREV